MALRTNIRFGLLLILGLAATEVAPVAAQTVANPVEIPACRTTAGEDGLLFQGMFAMVYAPVEFESVRAEEGKLSLFPEVRDELGMLAESKPGAATRAVIEFLAADGTVVHQCAVTGVTFDPEVQDLAQLQTGDCNLSLVAGRPQLVVGHAQVWEINWALPPARDAFGRARVEVGISDPSIADMSRFSERQLYLLGKSPGVTVLGSVVEEQDSSHSINLCPINVLTPAEVIGAEGPEDKDLCHDANGVPMRLSVGQTATMELREGDAQGIEVSEASTAAPDIADFSFAEGGTGATVKGLAPGSTSITLYNTDAFIAQHCEVSVE
jgi:hypothetical protein